MDKPNEDERPELPADRERESGTGSPLPEGGGEAPAEPGGTVSNCDPIDPGSSLIDCGGLYCGIVEFDGGVTIDVDSPGLLEISLPSEGEDTLVLEDLTPPGAEGAPEMIIPGASHFPRPIRSAAALRRIRGLVGNLWQRLSGEGRACLPNFLKCLAAEYEGYNEGAT